MLLQLTPPPRSSLAPPPRRSSLEGNCGIKVVAWYFGLFLCHGPVHCHDGPGRVRSRAGEFNGQFDAAERAGALGLTTKRPEITKNALRICLLHTTPEKRARENARGASPVIAEINTTPRLRRRNRSGGPPQTEESALIG